MGSAVVFRLGLQECRMEDLKGLEGGGNQLMLWGNDSDCSFVLAKAVAFVRQMYETLGEQKGLE